MNYPSEYKNYVLLEPIGQGGMSAIDLAQTSVSNAQYMRFLAIKRIHSKHAANDSFVRMFQDEARINAELQHANIPQVYDFGEFEDEYYIAMEYIPGVDLREVQKNIVRQERRIPTRISLKIMADVLDALHHAHTRVDTFGRTMHIVHRDVNPRNIMISIRGEIKLIDFGVAKAATKVDQTVGHALKGKFSYMSPEQIEGEKLDGRSDLFAMGLMFHELIENRRPFVKMNEVQIMHRILSANIPPLTDPDDFPYPERIHAIHQRALQVDPNDRYNSAMDMRQAIIDTLQDCGGMPSQSDVAEFLREVIPGRVNAIADRLDAYRQEFTQPSAVRQVVTEKKTDIDPVDSSKETLAVEIPQKPSSIISLVSWVAAIGTGLTVIMVILLWMWSQGNTASPPEITIAPKSNTPTQVQSNPTLPAATNSETQSADKAIESEKPTSTQDQTTTEKTTENPENATTAQENAEKSKERAKRKDREKRKKEREARQKAAKEEAARQEAARQEAARQEAARQEAAKQEQPEPEPVKQQAWVYFHAKGSDVKVYVDGNFIGNAPKRKKYSIGKHSVRFVSASGDSYSRSFTVKEGVNSIRSKEF